MLFRFLELSYSLCIAPFSLALSIRNSRCFILLKFKFLSFLNSAELRELEKKLKAAYMNKERAAQIAEKDAIKYEQMVIMFLVIMFSIFLASFRKAKI